MSTTYVPCRKCGGIDIAGRTNYSAAHCENCGHAANESVDWNDDAVLGRGWRMTIEQAFHDMVTARCAYLTADALLAAIPHSEDIKRMKADQIMRDARRKYRVSQGLFAESFDALAFDVVDYKVVKE